MLINMRRRVV